MKGTDLKRGQMWSMDFAVSIIIFAFVAAMVMFAWNYSTQNSMDQVNFNILQNDVIVISDSLIRVTGPIRILCFMRIIPTRM